MGTFCINREDLVALESRLEQSRFEQSRFEQSRLEQSRFEQSIGKMSESEAQDAFIIFDEAYEGKDVDAFYLADILRAVGCNVTNASATSHGKTEALGEKRITFGGRQSRHERHGMQGRLHRRLESLRQGVNRQG